jgi:hypothetical protein
LALGVVPSSSLCRFVVWFGPLAVSAACTRDPAPRDASGTATAPLAPVQQAAPPPAQPRQVSSDPTHAPELAPTQSESPPALGKGASATVGKARLALRGCQLEVELSGGRRQSKEIDLPSPCVFVTAGTQAQVEQTDYGQTLLVVSSKPLDGRPGDCDTKVRAVVVQGEKVTVSSQQQVMRMCGADGPFDTILFHTLAASST